MAPGTKRKRGYQATDGEIRRHSGQSQYSDVSARGHKIVIPKVRPDLPHLPDEFADRVFTHSSAVTTSRASAENDQSYERLEFYGDAVIQLYATQIIFNRFPNFPPGKMSDVRVSLVCNATLALFSQEYKLYKNLRTDENTSKMNEKVLGDVFEAYIGGLTLADPANSDSVVKPWLAALWEPTLVEIEGGEYNKGEGEIDVVNAKEKLRTKIVSPTMVTIEYENIEPPELKRHLGKTVNKIGCYITGWGYKRQLFGVGEGYSKAEAGNRAAAKALLEHSKVLDDMASQKKVHDAKVKASREQ
ncbi:MAG: hypothetical protein M1820_005454 [Bogoriella megaspora]|nr:MAG: hypothetical protein M1820_005454 [Bogoriella megaspora]